MPIEHGRKTDDTGFERAWATDEGVFIGPGIPLVRQQQTMAGRPYAPRPRSDLEAHLARAWGREIALSRDDYEALIGAGIAPDRGDTGLARQLARSVRHKSSSNRHFASLNSPRLMNLYARNP